MDKLLTATDITARYQCSEPTARKYMRQMLHLENPLRVTENALRAWESERAYGPGEKPGKRAEKWPRGKNKGKREIFASAKDYHIPRRRTANA